MKVTRADWAGSVPWAGITGKPAELTSAGEVATDLSQLTARVAALEAAINSLSSAPDDSPLTAVSVWWAVGALEPLQMAYEDLAGPVGADAKFAVGAPLAAGTGVFFEAYSLGAGVFRIVAVNLSGATVTLPMTNFTLFVLNG